MPPGITNERSGGSAALASSHARSSHSVYSAVIRSRSRSPPAGTERSAPRSSRSFCIRRSHCRDVVRQPRLQQRHAQHRVQLVHRAVCLHAGVQLGDTAHVPEVRLAGVAELGVDAGEIDRHAPSESRRWSIGVARVRAIGYVPDLHAGWRSEGDCGGRAPGGARARGGRQAEGQRAGGSRAARRGRRRAAARRRVRRRRRRANRRRRRGVAAPMWSSRSPRPPRSEVGLLGDGLAADRLPRAAVPARQTTRALARREGDGAGDGGDPADLPRAVDGRALLAVQRRGLPRGAARRRARWAASTRC